jgi:hypothetical protein
MCQEQDSSSSCFCNALMWLEGSDSQRRVIVPSTGCTKRHPYRDVVHCPSPMLKQKSRRRDRQRFVRPFGRFSTYCDVVDAKCSCSDLSVQKRYPASITVVAVSSLVMATRCSFDPTILHSTPSSARPGTDPQSPRDTS